MMSRATRNNIKRRMGVLFIERKYRTRYETAEDGTEVAVKVPYDEKKLLTAPVIQSSAPNSRSPGSTVRWSPRNWR